MKWEVAVTTAPRKDCTLLGCIESIRDCGWEPTVFAEPDSTPTDCLTIHNQTRLGVWHNWRKSVQYCLDQNPDLILTVQDDSLFHPDCREFVESLILPSDMGYLSLYCPKHYQHWANGTPRSFGVYDVRTKSVWGAMAFVFRPEVLERLINHPKALSWIGVKIKGKKDLSKLENRLLWEKVKQNRKENPYLIQNSDTAIGRILSQHMKLKLIYVSPSPVDHCSKYSSIGHGGNNGKRNAFFIADRSLPLDYQVNNEMYNLRINQIQNV